MKHFLYLSALSVSLLASSVLQAACFPDTPLTRPDSRYEAANASGTEVKDKETGLVWQRCVYGLKWDGAACSGIAIAQDWKTANKFALDAKWRLPTQAELEGLSEKKLESSYVFLTHAGRALALWRGKFPAEIVEPLEYVDPATP